MTFESDGLWFKIPSAIVSLAESRFLHFMGGIHAVEHAAIGIFPLLVLTDRNDLGGISTPFHPQVNGPAVFIFDAAAGGAGLVRQAFKKAEKLLAYTLNAIKDCPCENGCPSCVHSPKCGSGNRPIDKAAAIFILEQMMCADKIQDESLPETVKMPGTPLLAEEQTLSEKTLVSESETPPPQRTGKKSIHQIRRIRRKRNQTIADVSSGGMGQGAKSSLRYGVLDIETQRSAQEVGGWHRADLMRVSCVVVYDSKTGEYLEYLEGAMDRLLEVIQEFDLLVGFNIKRFDYRVLSGYTDFDFKQIHTLDILEDVHAHLGYRLSLDHLAGVTLGVQKSGNGLQALEWWKQGRINDIIDYCRKDVEITRSLFEFGRQNGYLLFTNKAKQTVRIPVQWDKSLSFE
jgi:DEAD/DEAH box helicase domain-containing protein